MKEFHTEDEADGGKSSWEELYLLGIWVQERETQYCSKKMVLKNSLGNSVVLDS